MLAAWRCAAAALARVSERVGIAGELFRDVDGLVLQAEPARYKHAAQ